MIKFKVMSLNGKTRFTPVFEEIKNGEDKVTLLTCDSVEERKRAKQSLNAYCKRNNLDWTFDNYKSSMMYIVRA